MKSNLMLSFAGLSLGGIISMTFSLLFLAWPIRALGSAFLLILAALVLLRRSQNPLQGAMLFTAWFFIGFAISSALVSILDIIFPPLD